MNTRWNTVVLFAGACFIPVLSAGTVYSTTVLADNPVAYYRLGEAPGETVAVDSSVNGHNGTYGGSPTLGVPGLIRGDPDTAVNFNGSNSSPFGAPVGGYVTINDVPYLDLANSSFTIEAWVNGMASTANRRVFDKALANTAIGYGMDVSISDLRLLGVQELEYTPSIPLSQFQTYYIVGTSDGSGHGSIYLNGVLVLSGAFSAPSSYTGAAHIGIASDGTAEAVGVLDEVAVYNYALSPSQVAAHYDAAAVPEPGTTVMLAMAGIFGCFRRLARRMTRQHGPEAQSWR